MTYQGERARAMASEVGRFFEVSKVRLGADGLVSEVLWGEVAAGSNLNVGAPVRVPVADVVDAIHDGAQVSAAFSGKQAHQPERLFVVFEHSDGSESIALEEPPSPGRNLVDLPALDD